MRGETVRGAELKQTAKKSGAFNHQAYVQWLTVNRYAKVRRGGLHPLRLPQTVVQALVFLVDYTQRPSGGCLLEIGEKDLKKK